VGYEEFDEKIPLLRPRLPSLVSISGYIEKIDKSQIYSNHGPLVRELEARYGALLGVGPNNIVAVSSATLGMTLAVQNHPANIWRVPDFTFAATALAVLNAGKELVLEDVDQDNWALQHPPRGDISKFGHLVVMPFGNNSTFANWKFIPNVIFDAAASLGDPSWNLENLPNSHTVIFSLHATKVFGAGEGGLVICGNSESADLLRTAINFGFGSGREVSTLGTNAKMSEYSAAIALAALDQKSDEATEWEVSQGYARKLALEVAHTNPNLEACPVNPYFILRFKTEVHLLDFMNLATSLNIETRKWWPRAIHQMPLFAEGKHGNIRANVNEDSTSVTLASTVLGLPMSRDMTSDNFERISCLLNESKGSFQNSKVSGEEN